MAKKKVFLVYQSGIANVFEVKAFNLANYGRDAKRLLQHSYHSCRMFCEGMATCGAIIRTAACNMGGDIINEHWTEDLEGQPFADKLVDIRRN